MTKLFLIINIVLTILLAFTLARETGVIKGSVLELMWKQECRNIDGRWTVYVLSETDRRFVCDFRTKETK